MLDQSYCRKADEIIDYYGRSKFSDSHYAGYQGEYRYLPGELSHLCEEISVTEAKAYSVATFYENFSFDQKGKYIIKVCDRTCISCA